MITVPLLSSSESFIIKALSWLETRQDHIYYFNPNRYNNYPQQPFRHLLAFGSEQMFEIPSAENFFDRWEALRTQYPTDWMFVFASYDCKNSVEVLTSSKEPGIRFSTATFVIPSEVWEITENAITILKGTGDSTITEIASQTEQTTQQKNAITLSPLITKDAYIHTVEQIQQFIRAGNAYEINYCMPFKGYGKINPVETYTTLNRLSPMPFSAFYKYKNEYILSASPERFIKKTANSIVSQPIKGTSKRGATQSEDQNLSYALKHSVKEQSENTMIVDLVRNDLSRTAAIGSVHVPELSGMYTFPNVHQLISTVQSTIDPAYTGIDVIKAAFPMGSMTGAPKVSAMKFIDEIETVARGPFSGTIGYMDPEDNFDFNVLIRSIFYNNSTHEIFMEAGSAITSYAEAKYEYNECLLKINPIQKTLNSY